ncbi:YncE family protein, partial [Caldiplasma sukawensis]
MRRISIPRKITLPQVFVAIVIFSFLAASVQASVGQFNNNISTSKGINVSSLVQVKNYTETGFVKYTLLLFNNTLLNGNVYTKNCDICPFDATFDSSTGNVYAINYHSNTVSVINDTTNKVISTISVGTNPEEAAFDSSTGNVYVTNFGSSSVSVINDTTNKVISTISVGTNPVGVAFDSFDSDIYVANLNSNTVSVINGCTNTVISTISVGKTPFGVAFDLFNGNLYVTNENANTVSVINGYANTVISTISVGANPDGITFDSSNGYIYVDNYNSNTVSVINPATNTVISTISVGSVPNGIDFASSNGYIYVSNSGSNTVSVINGSTNTVISTISVGANPVGITFDSSNGYIYVVNFYSGSVSIIPTIKQLYYYCANFTESGLPSGAPWYVNITIHDSGPITGTSYSLSLPNGTYTYTIGTTNKLYHANEGSFTVNGSKSNNTIMVSFSLVTYTVTFIETGIESGQSWNVDINGVTHTVTGSFLTLSGTNGTSFTYSIVNSSSYYV